MRCYCRSVLATGMFSRGGMARYIGHDVRNGANSNGAWSWMRGEPFTCARDGVFQSHKCLLPRRDMAVSEKRLRLYLRVLEVYKCDRDHGWPQACMALIYNADFDALSMYACVLLVRVYEV